jgi:hypothetical protein
MHLPKMQSWPLVDNRQSSEKDFLETIGLEKVIGPSITYVRYIPNCSLYSYQETHNSSHNIQYNTYVLCNVNEGGQNDHKHVGETRVDEIRECEGHRRYRYLLPENKRRKKRTRT